MQPSLRKNSDASKVIQLSRLRKLFSQFLSQYKPIRYGLHQGVRKWVYFRCTMHRS